MFTFGLERDICARFSRLIAQGALNLLFKSGGSSAGLGGMPVGFPTCRLCLCCGLWVSSVENTPQPLFFSLGDREKVSALSCWL